MKAARAAQKARQEAKKKKKVSEPSELGGAGLAVFQVQEKCEQVREYREGDTEAADLSKPFLIQCSSEAQASFDSEPSIKSSLYGDFMQLFRTQSPIQRMDRCTKRYDGTELDRKLTARMTALLSATALTAKLPSSLRGPMGVQAVIIAKNTVKIYPEKSHLGTARYHQHRILFWSKIVVIMSTICRSFAVVSQRLPGGCLGAEQRVCRACQCKIIA